LKNNQINLINDLKIFAELFQVIGGFFLREIYIIMVFPKTLNLCMQNREHCYKWLLNMCGVHNLGEIDEVMIKCLYLDLTKSVTDTSTKHSAVITKLNVYILSKQFFKRKKVAKELCIAFDNLFMITIE